jgi:hypothetical protein
LAAGLRRRRRPPSPRPEAPPRSQPRPRASPPRSAEVGMHVLGRALAVAAAEGRGKEGRTPFPKAFFQLLARLGGCICEWFLFSIAICGCVLLLTDPDTMARQLRMLSLCRCRGARDSAPLQRAT